MSAIVQCLECGKSFQKKTDHQPQYCSPACQKKAQSDKNLGTKPLAKLVKNVYLDYLQELECGHIMLTIKGQGIPHSSVCIFCAKKENPKALDFVLETFEKMDLQLLKELKERFRK